MDKYICILITTVFVVAIVAIGFDASDKNRIVLECTKTHEPDKCRNLFK